MLHISIDPLLCPASSVAARTYNTYSARNYQRNARFRFLNAVNGAGATDPRDPAIEYSLNSQTAANATTEFYNGNGFNKHGATVTPAIGGTYRRGAFRADVQAQMSRSTNYYHTVEMGFFDTATSGQLPGLTLRWNRENGGDEAVNITQLAGPDWRRPENYTAPAAMNRRTNTGKDQPSAAETLLLNLRNHWDIKEQIDSAYSQLILKV